MDIASLLCVCTVKKNGIKGLMVFLKSLDLLHYLTENGRAVLRRIAVLDKAYLNVKFELVTDIIVIKPICER